MAGSRIGFLLRTKFLYTPGNVNYAKRELSECRQVDEKVKRKKSGKWAIIGDNIAICTVEIRDVIFAAENQKPQVWGRFRKTKNYLKATIPTVL